MRQKSIGEVLNTARELRGYSLIELQRKTRIQAKYLQALEYNDFEAIPDKAYVRSFLQRYAEELDLDAGVLLEAYDSQSFLVYYESEEDGQSQAELSRSYKVKRKKSASYLALIYLLALAFLILGFVVYIVQSRLSAQSHQTSTSTSYTVVSSSTTTEQTTESTTSSSSTVSTVDSVRLSVTGSGSTVSATLTGVTGDVAITLTADNTTSWVSVTDTDLSDGVTLTPENTTVTTTLNSGVSTATITIGVVKGVTVKVAGQVLDLSGLTEQSGFIQLTIQ